MSASASRLGRLLALAVWTPWCAGAALLLACVSGLGPALERANHDETHGFTRRVLSAADVQRFEQGSEPYPWSVALGLGLGGAVLLVLHLLRGRFREPGELRAAFTREALALRRVVPWVLGLLAVVAAHSVAKYALGWDLDTKPSFPISIFQPVLHLTGLGFAAAFVAVFAWAWGRADGGAGETWLVGLLLLFLGNLVQGGFYEAFEAPFVATDVQYYSEALRISDARQWTANFDELQATLSCHARTHPPFAVLLHLALLRSVGLAGLAAVFLLATSTAVPLLSLGVRALGADPACSRRLGLLLAVLPAVNVYGAVSLDGVVLALATLVLYGLVRLGRGRTDLRALFALGGGLVAMNLLTFGGLLLLASTLALGVLRVVRAREPRLLLAAVFTLLVLVLLVFVGRSALDYDHVTALRTAADLERGTRNVWVESPRSALFTRLEGVTEFLLFASPVVLAWVARRGTRVGGSASIAWSVVLPVLVALLWGNYRTGETARSCLFVYPFVLLALREIPASALDACLWTAALQTILMQATGTFFW